jgi:hypothetical protein
MMTSDEVRAGVLCEDDQGKQLKITHIDDEGFVNWEYIDSIGGGRTWMQQFKATHEAIRNVA